MIGIMVVSHEPLGTALIHCTRHIYGRMPAQLAALDVIPDEDPEAALRAGRELLARINDGSGAVVLTDVYGATPSRVAMRLAVRGRVRVLAGVNLPMLLKAIAYRNKPLDELSAMLIEGAREAIRPADGEPDAGAAPAQHTSPDAQG
jgi:PTS system ascorbate-specific IIA component